MEVTHSSLNEPFGYDVFPVGDDLPRTSDAPLHPGDLAMFSGEVSPKAFRFDYLKLTFFEEEQVYMDDPEARPKNDMSANFVEEVISRDHGRCVVTGAGADNGPLNVTWIYPPIVGSEPDCYEPEIGQQFTDDLEQYLTISNALTLREGIAELFRQNFLGIDVDDNYRIVFFVPYDEYAPFDPRTYLDISSDDPLRPSDMFLRTHFERCLLCHFPGGDVRSDFWDYDLNDFCEQMGVFDNDVDPNDPEWQTTFGKEVWGMLIRQGLQRRLSRQHRTCDVDPDE